MAKVEQTSNQNWSEVGHTLDVFVYLWKMERLHFPEETSFQLHRFDETFQCKAVLLQVGEKPSKIEELKDTQPSCVKE